MGVRWKAQSHGAVSSSLLTPRTWERRRLGELCSDEGAPRWKFSLLQLRRDGEAQKNLPETRKEPYLISNQLIGNLIQDFFGIFTLARTRVLTRASLRDATHLI